MKYFLIVATLCVSLFSNSQVAGTLTEVYFDFDSYQLTEQAKKRIDVELKLFNETSKIELIGFTDKIGGSLYNLKLSKKRSHSVELYLVSKGVLAKSIIKSEGQGEREKYTELYKNRAVSMSITTFQSLKKTIETPTDKKEIEVVELKEEVSELEVKAEVKAEKQTLTEEVNELNVGETIAIKGLNFIPGRHILLKSSEQKLYELLALLQANPTLKIEIQGHVCCSRDGQDGYDVDTDSKLLSLNRAINIYNYLVRQGVNASRLSYKGFGPTKPLAIEIDEMTRQMNRRVELKIIEK